MVNLNTLAKKRNASGNKKLHHGSYKSRVKDVCWSEGHVEGVAFDVIYELTDAKGNTFDFKEKFFTENNTRTEDFCNYLFENGIVELSDFVDCEEQVTLQIDVKNNRSFFTITTRNFIQLSNKETGNVGIS